MRGFWTVRRDEILRVSWRDGVALDTIAIAIGTTRNAIVGRKNRLRLPPRETRALGRVSYPTTRRRKHEAKPATEIIVRVKKPKAVAPTVPMVVAATPPCTLMELSLRRCRWPVDELYCGAVDPEINPRRPYCCEHSKLAYGRQPAVKLKRRLPSVLAPASTYYGSVR